MKTLNFKESNVTYAEHQPEYTPLPTLRSKEGKVVSCWGLSFIERLKVLITGRIWLSVLTFNQRLQPLLMSAHKPFKAESAVK